MNETYRKATTIATSIDVASDKIRYDAACKQILAEKIILAWIMKSTMKEYFTVSVRDIAEKYIIGTPQISEVPVLPDETNAPKITGTGVEDTTITEGTVTFDIRFYALHPISGEKVRLMINVEAQNDFYPGYPLIKRAIYYCSRMISSQYGTEFEQSHYEKIKKVYSVWICLNPPIYRENTITGYHITEYNIIGDIHEPVSDYDLFTAIMICLGNSDISDGKGLLHLLDVLLASETDTTTKKRILQEEYDIPMTQEFERRINDMCNLSEGVYQKGIEKGIQKGIEKGMQQGIEKGMQQGIELEKERSIKAMMDTLHLTVDQAMDALKLDPEEKEKYASKIC